MKKFFVKLKRFIEVHCSKPVLFFTAVFILMVFAMIGMVVTVQLWFPLVVLAVILYGIYAAYLHSNSVITPERKVLLTNVISSGISTALRRKLPYAFDIPQREVIAKKMNVFKDAGIEVATVTLTLMEKNVEEVDLKLLYKIFSDRLYNFCESTPGLGIRPVSIEWTVLTLADIQLSDMEVVLRIIVADNWRAANFLNSWFKDRNRSHEKRSKNGGKRNGIST